MTLSKPFSTTYPRFSVGTKHCWSNLALRNCKYTNKNMLLKILLKKFRENAITKFKYTYL